MTTIDEAIRMLSYTTRQNGGWVAADHPEHAEFVRTLLAHTVASPPASVEEIVEKLSDGWLLVKRGLYKRPDHRGYTGLSDRAGRFSLDEARRYVSISGGEIGMVHESIAAPLSPNADPSVAVELLLSDRAAMAERVAGLERRLSEQVARADQQAEWAIREVEKAVASEAEVARLREALEPFAKVLSGHEPWCPDDTPISGFLHLRDEPARLTFGHFRIARAALTRPEEPTKET